MGGAVMGGTGGATECRWCGTPFAPYKNKTFCDARCRQADDRRRYRGKYRPVKMHWNGAGDPACGINRGPVVESAADLSAVTCASCLRVATALADAECCVEGCTKIRYRRQRMCSMHSARVARSRKHGEPTTDRIDRRPTPEQTSARFWAKVDKRGPGECWPFHGTIQSNGYGIISIHGKRKMAHRFAYEDVVGLIPDGLTIDHVAARGCVRTDCCNPAHLEPVTAGENVLRSRAAPALNKRKTVCPKCGGPYRLSSGKRHCPPCKREWERRRKGRAA